MADKSNIEWTDATWNPVRGCQKVSPGCRVCYAETFAERWRGVRGHAFEQGFDLRLVPDALSLPLRWARPRRIFVNSMSDLFWEAIEVEYVAAVFRVMGAARQHHFQVLTKRPAWARSWFGWAEGRMREKRLLYPGLGESHAYDEALLTHGLKVADVPTRYTAAWPLPNVWLGVSVEDRKHGLPRVDELRALPAAVRWLSVEPLLEDLGPLDLTGIDWVVCGGESGARSRPMHPDWARSVRDQCVAAGVPFFFKQWGGVNKKKAGRELDGRTWDEMPKAYAPPAGPRALPVIASGGAGQGTRAIGGPR